MHTMELPFVFDNVEIAKAEVGTGPDLQPLADKISGAWVAFARTGNPSHKGLPKWTPYDMNRRATMVFNNQCKLVDDLTKKSDWRLKRPGRARVSSQRLRHFAQRSGLIGIQTFLLGQLGGEQLRGDDVGNRREQLVDGIGKVMALAPSL